MWIWTKATVWSYEFSFVTARKRKQASFEQILSYVEIIILNTFQFPIDYYLTFQASARRRLKKSACVTFPREA